MAPKTQKNVTIYSTPTCGFCDMAKTFFKENGVKYTEHDVASNEEKRNEMFEKSGQMGVPVIEIGGDIIVGFNKGKIKSALGL